MQKERKRNVDNALVNILKTSEESQKKRRLRSNFKFQDNEENSAPVFNLEDVEYVKYTGDIIFCEDFYSIAEYSDQIIKFVEQNKDNGKGKVALGFDMEWAFSFKTGPDKTALLQFCTSLDKCYLFHIYYLKKIPQALTALMHHPNVIFHGNNIKNDCRKLARDFSVFKADIMIANCLDLGIYYNEICSSSGRWSLDRLAVQVCRLRVNKDRNVRMSKWHFLPLTEDQKLYAAIDVYVSSRHNFES